MTSWMISNNCDYMRTMELNERSVQENKIILKKQKPIDANFNCSKLGIVQISYDGF